MSNSDWIDPMFPPAVLFREACPDITAALVRYFETIGASDLISQLNKVWVLAQAFRGPPDNFSFRAYPLPGLTYEERCAMELLEERAIDVDIPGGNIKIVLGDFGQIDWFYMMGFPDIRHELRRYKPKMKGRMKQEGKVGIAVRLSSRVKVSNRDLVSVMLSADTTT